MNIFYTIFQHHKILLALGLMSLSTLSAQVGLSNYNQTPMLIHPSLVGSSGGKRASVAYGRTYETSPISYSYTKGNYCNLYYDQIWKKLGSGIGGYLNLAKNPNTGTDYLSPYAKTRQHSVAGGVAIAPKYTIMSAKNPDEIRFTWSPSLFFNYNYKNVNASVEIPDNSPLGLTEDTSYYQSRIHDLTTALGGMFNSKILMLGLTLNYEFRHNKRKSQNTKFDREITYNDPYSHLLSTSMMFGVSLPKRENSLVGFSSTLKFSLSLSRFNPSNIPNPYYFNTNLRVWRILFGASAALSPLGYTESWYIGYKAKKWRATVGTYGHFSKYRFVETTLMYNF